MLSKFRIVAITSICCVTLLTAQNQPKDQSEKWEPLVQAIQDILAGKSIHNTNIIISPSAYLAFGNRYENLKSVVTGESKTCSLKEDSTRATSNLVLKINDSENAAFVMLKTQTNKKNDERYHTVVFMKDSKDIWAIQAWHASN